MANEILNIWSDAINSFNDVDSGLENDSIGRKSAMKAFLEFGIPNQKKEEWKYTPVSFLNNTAFLPVTNNNFVDIGLEYDEYISSLLFDDKANILVFINGLFSKKLSRINTNDTRGLFLGSLSEALNLKLISKDELIPGAIPSDMPFNYLNQTFYLDGACIILPADFSLTEPVHILHIADSKSENKLISPKNVIIAGQNSNLRFVETYHNKSELPAFFNSSTRVKAGNNSVIDYFKFQNDESELYQIGSTNIEQADNSIVNSFTVTLHGKFIRNNLSTNLNGRHCEANFHGFYFLDDNNFADNHTLVNHLSPDCNSNEIYKGILDDKAVAVFNGKVFVAKDAQKTNAYQTNKNILLSDNCIINTKPQLEIFADDVKCSHGATSGNIDEESMFYLKARGIPEAKAKSLLLNAFGIEIIDKINIPQLRDYIREQISIRLKLEDVLLRDSIDNMN